MSSADQRGGVRYSARVPLARDSAKGEPRSVWEKMAQRSSPGRNAFRVIDMSPALKFARGRDQLVQSGAIRPEFGPSKYEVARRTRAYLDRADSGRTEFDSPLERPSVAMMTEATGTALSTVSADARPRRFVSDLTRQFSKVEHLPDFSKGSWKKVYSTHSGESYEHILPGSSGMAIKLYINDEDNDGMNTATITAPTSSLDHYGAWPAYKLTLPVNSRNAAIYLDQVKRDKR